MHGNLGNYIDPMKQQRKNGLRITMNIPNTAVEGGVGHILDTIKNGRQRTVIVTMNIRNRA